jgi:hypothetical protein
MTEQFTFTNVKCQTHVFTKVLDPLNVCGYHRLFVTHSQVVQVAQGKNGGKAGEKWLNGQAEK